MNQDDHVLRMVYVTMAAVAGAITALSFMRWKEMTWGDIGFTLFVGAAFAIFAIPWLVSDIMRVDMGSLRVACGVTYFGATGANAFIPLILAKVRRKYGLEETGP